MNGEKLLEKQVMEDKSKSVFLIDEADVLYTEKFGSFQGYIVKISKDWLREVQKAIWVSLSENKQTDNIFPLQNLKILEMVKQDSMYKLLEQNSQIGFINTHIELMKRAAGMIYDGLNKNEKFKYEYRFNENTGRIEIKGSDDKFSSEISYYKGYYNIFCYLATAYQKGRGFINLNENEYGFMGVEIGGVSYSEIPLTAFSRIFGVSGTLRELTEQENSLLKEYAIDRISFYPSFFGASRRCYEGISLLPTRDEWFKNIAAAIKSKIESDEKSVAVLVFFDEEKELLKFNSDYKHDFFCRYEPLFITQNLSFENRKIDDLISELWAGRAGQVTLLTKVFGRGVDFQADAKVNKNGGMHVIQTFLSQDPKEEVQIQGRTARKDQPGSYEQIWCSEDLNKLDYQVNTGSITGLKVEKEKASHPIYQSLIEQRNQKYQNLCVKKLENVLKYKQEHNNTHNFFLNAIQYANESNRSDYIKHIINDIKNFKS